MKQYLKLFLIEQYRDFSIFASQEFLRSGADQKRLASEDEISEKIVFMMYYRFHRQSVCETEGVLNRSLSVS